MNRLQATLLAAGLASLLSGCGGSTPEPESTADTAAPAAPTPTTEVMPAAVAVSGAPTAAELAAATYSGLMDLEGPVQLSDGQWQGEPFVPDGSSRPSVMLAPGFRLTGDLNGDGAEEAVVVLAQNSGGSGTVNYLAAVGRDGDAVRNLATVALGDRVAIRSGTIESGTLRVSVLRSGAGDAMCCPGELADLAWTLADNQFVAATAAGVTGRLSLETLAGTEWVLRAWDLNEPAPTDPEVTLAYQDGRVAGGSGCNRYFAGAQTTATPGELTIGQSGSTQMACPDPQTEVETRYLKQLAGVGKYGFLLGRLALSYQDENGTHGVMLFEGRVPQQ